MAPPRGVALALAAWAAITALLAGVAALRLEWGWWIAPATWGVLPIGWWLLKGPDAAWGVSRPAPPRRSAVELLLGLALVAGAAYAPARWAPVVAPSGALVVVLCLWAPCVEELFFRGWLQGALRGRCSPAGVVTFPALLFALSHAAVTLSWLGLATVVPALLFGALRERQGSLLPAVVLHAAANGALLLWSHLLAVPSPA